MTSWSVTRFLTRDFQIPLKRLRKNKILLPWLSETRLVSWKTTITEAHMYTLHGIETQFTSKWTGSDIVKENYAPHNDSINSFSFCLLVLTFLLCKSMDCFLYDRDLRYKLKAFLWEVLLLPTKRLKFR